MDWRDKLKAYKHKMLGQTAADDQASNAAASLANLRARAANAQVASVGARLKSQPPMVILLGVDFGTSFTKVVWRDWGGDDRYGVVRLGSTDYFRASEVWRDARDHLHLEPASAEARSERWLKMRLADPQGDPSSVEDLLAMSIFFVGRAIRDAKAFVTAQFSGRTIQWAGGALGCPAAYHDDDRLPLFQRVADAAWAWAADPKAPSDLDSLRGWCAQSWPDAAATNFEVRAEVAAAVDCFTMRPDASSGVYVFLDVGGGTLDGACFKLDRRSEHKDVFLFASKVERLGVEEARRAACQEWMPQLSNVAEQLIRTGRGEFKAELGWLKKELYRFIGTLIAEGKGDENWLQLAFQRPAAWRSFDDQLKDARPLPIFLGGGGMAHAVYRECADTVWAKNSLKNFDIPPLATGQFTPPNADWPATAPFHRCAVAYGLTRPTDQAGNWRLLTKAQTKANRHERQVGDRNGIDYLSSADAYQ